MANHTGVTRLRRAALAAVGAGVPVSWLLAGTSSSAVSFVDPAAAPQVSPLASAPKTVVVGDAAEGWYTPSLINLCSTPLGCLPTLLPSIYPANTLHVGVALGGETARTYLKPDLTKVPAGSRIVEATMTLPVATTATDGTLSPAAATVVACPATQPFDDGAAASPKALPRTACTHGYALKYDAKHDAFTVDITTLVAGWSNGSVEDGIAVMADAPKVSLTDFWQLAFNGRRLVGAPHIKTSISFVPPQDGTEVPAPSASASPTAPEVMPAVPEISLPDGSLADAQPPAPVVAPTLAPVAQPVALSRGFKYPMAFLFPIALLAAGVFLTRLFTRDATPVKRR
jgi:hypothetical protein